MGDNLRIGIGDMSKMTGVSSRQLRLLHRVFRTLIKGIELTDETEIKGRVDLGTADSYHVYGVVDEKGTRIELEKE